MADGDRDPYSQIHPHVMTEGRHSGRRLEQSHATMTLEDTGGDATVCAGSCSDAPSRDGRGERVDSWAQSSAHFPVCSPAPGLEPRAG